MFLATRLVMGVLLLFRCIEDFFLLALLALDVFHRPAHTVISVSLNFSFSFSLPFVSFNCSPLCCFSHLSDELSNPHTLNFSFSFSLPFVSFNCSPLCCFSHLSDELSDLQVDSDSGLGVDSSFWTVCLGTSYVLSVVHFGVFATTRRQFQTSNY